MFGDYTISAAGDKGCHVQSDGEGENRLRMRLGEVKPTPADAGVVLYDHCVSALIAHNESEA